MNSKYKEVINVVQNKKDKAIDQIFINFILIIDTTLEIFETMKDYIEPSEKKVIKDTIEKVVSIKNGVLKSQDCRLIEPFYNWCDKLQDRKDYIFSCPDLQNNNISDIYKLILGSEYTRESSNELESVYLDIAEKYKLNILKTKKIEKILSYLQNIVLMYSVLNL